MARLLSRAELSDASGRDAGRLAYSLPSPLSAAAALLLAIDGLMLDVEQARQKARAAVKK